MTFPITIDPNYMFIFKNENNAFIFGELVLEFFTNIVIKRTRIDTYIWFECEDFP